jgi:hypothetical protein
MRAPQFPTKLNRRIAAAVTAVVAGLFGLGLGTAYAYWTSHGAGSGVATIGSAVTVHVQAVASGTPSTKLVPTGGTADLLVQVQNLTSVPVSVVGISQNGSVVPTGSPGPGTTCTGANSGVTVPTQTSLAGQTVAGNSTTVLHIPNGAMMGTSSASGCQGMSFDIPITLTVHQ